MDERGPAPGYFGKLPSHGDFVGRGLPPAVRDCFDRWLQEVLISSRGDLADEWLRIWLGSPLWRFLMAPDICDGYAWAGVMTPSHDRVGRSFPLMLAANIDGNASLRNCLTRHAAWFAQLEEVALSALASPLSLSDLEAGLAAVGGLSCTEQAPPFPPTFDLASDAVAMLRDPGLPALVGVAIKGRSAWWTTGSDLVAPSLAVCGGLPAPERFTALLDGNWRRRGWHAA